MFRRHPELILGTVSHANWVSSVGEFSRGNMAWTKNVFDYYNQSTCLTTVIGGSLEISRHCGHFQMCYGQKKTLNK